MLSFADAPGNWFNALGRLGKVLLNSRAYQLDQQSAMTDLTTGVTIQLENQPDIQAINGAAWISIVNSAGSLGGTQANIAQQYLNRLIFQDTPQINQTLQQINLFASLQELIRQMKLAGATIQECTVTGTATQFSAAVSNVGNGIINVSVKRPIDGLVQQNAFAENIAIQCAADSYSGGAAEGNEGFSVTGTGLLNDVFAFDWPLGSNCSLGISAIDGSQDVTSGNLLTNSDFEEWTANVPDNFTLVTGAGGTNVFENNVIVYSGDASLQITGAGGLNTSLTQLFNTDTGTTGALEVQTGYSVNLWLRRDGVAAAAGVLTVDLIDENGTVIQDAAGVNNSFTIDLTALTTSFVAYQGAFRTPAILPTTQRLRLWLSTPLTNGRSVYLDKLSFGLFTRCYIGGPYVAVHSGSTPFLRGDYGAAAIANSRGGATDGVSTFQTLIDRLCGTRTFGLIIPYSASPTISDQLITGP